MGEVRLEHVEDEAVALARIAAGIHFRFSCEVATQMGAEVAGYASATWMLRLHGERERSAAAETCGNVGRRKSGFVAEVT